jgi:hypothetical protein
MVASVQAGQGYGTPLPTFASLPAKKLRALIKPGNFKLLGKNAKKHLDIARKKPRKFVHQSSLQ